MLKRGFKGVWIPAEIWLNYDLNIMEKAFFMEIDSLDNEDGCFASNDHFSKFSGLSKSRCSEIIKSLEKKGAITISYTYKFKNGVQTKEVDRRIINVVRQWYRDVRDNYEAALEAAENKRRKPTEPPVESPENTPFEKPNTPPSDNRIPPLRETECPPSDNRTTPSENRKIDNQFSKPSLDNQSVSQELDRQTNLELENIKIILEENIQINCLKEEDATGLVEEIELNIIEMYLQSNTVIKGQAQPKALVQAVINKLTYRHIHDIIERLNTISERTKIKNNKAYLQTLIYNAPFETVAALKTDIKYNLGY